MDTLSERRTSLKITSILCVLGIAVGFGVGRIDRQSNAERAGRYSSGMIWVCEGRAYGPIFLNHVDESRVRLELGGEPIAAENASSSGPVVDDVWAVPQSGDLQITLLGQVLAQRGDFAVVIARGVSTSMIIVQREIPVRRCR